MEDKLYHAPSKCPVCGNDLTITRLTCGACSSEIVGAFRQSKFALLSQKDIQFIEVFVRNRGSIKEVERELGVSYPTVRSMLDHVIEQIELIEGKQAASRSERTKDEILDLLESGQITSAEAVKMLKEL